MEYTMNMTYNPSMQVRFNKRHLEPISVDKDMRVYGILRHYGPTIRIEGWVITDYKGEPELVFESKNAALHWFKGELHFESTLTGGTLYMQDKVLYEERHMEGLLHARLRKYM